ncbi:uncharacterized protein LOC144146638 [Haemaphysalis longicornis]
MRKTQMEANAESVFSAAREKIQVLDGSRRDPGIRRRHLLRNLWRDWARPASSGCCDAPTGSGNGDSVKVENVPAVELGSTYPQKRSGDPENDAANPSKRRRLLCSTSPYRAAEDKADEPEELSCDDEDDDSYPVMGAPFPTSTDDYGLPQDEPVTDPDLSFLD